MIIYDPIYGNFELPPSLTELVQTPEVRRLSQIRLLNTLTPSLATLGEIRRFSHTLGVLYLVLQNRLMQSQPQVLSALGAAVLLHDIGTPPFAHLLEYHLKERTGWTHENVIKSILYANHVPEGRANQFFARSVVKFRRELRKTNIDADLVEAIVGGEHPLSPLLFGTLDFDNLDNVARMAWALGQPEFRNFTLAIAEHLSVVDKELGLPRTLQPAVERWLEARRACYGVIVFDPPTVAAQAVLSIAIEALLEEGGLTEFDWVLTDELLLERLLDCPKTKGMIATTYLGRLPQQVYSVQISDDNMHRRGRAELRAAIETSLAEFFDESGLGYVFVDKGTFGKQLRFVDPESNQPWSLGVRSCSTVLYGFTRRNTKLPARDCVHALEALLKHLGVPSARVIRAQIGTSHKTPDAQESLNLAAS
jgi:HD superfamily phosphohydrolase